MDRFDELLDEAKQLRHAASAMSTKATYRSFLNAYLHYCKYFGRTPVPADQLTLVSYVAFLARSLNPNSVAGYLNVICVLHLSVGLSNPLEDNWEITMLRRAFARIKGTPY